MSLHAHELSLVPWLERSEEDARSKFMRTNRLLRGRARWSAGRESYTFVDNVIAIRAITEEESSQLKPL
jgi:hypothetical protein